MKKLLQILKHGKHDQKSHGRKGARAVGTHRGGVDAPTVEVSKLIEDFKPSDVRTSGKRTTMTVSGSETQTRRRLQQRGYKKEGRGQDALYAKGDHEIMTRPTTTTTTRVVVFHPASE